MQIFFITVDYCGLLLWDSKEREKERALIDQKMTSTTCLCLLFSSLLVTWNAANAPIGGTRWPQELQSWGESQPLVSIAVNESLMVGYLSIRVLTSIAKLPLRSMFTLSLRGGLWLQFDVYYVLILCEINMCAQEQFRISFSWSQKTTVSPSRWSYDTRMKSPKSCKTLHFGSKNLLN